MENHIPLLDSVLLVDHFNRVFLSCPVLSFSSCLVYLSVCAGTERMVDGWWVKLHIAYSKEIIIVHIHFEWGDGQSSPTVDSMVWPFFLLWFH